MIDSERGGYSQRQLAVSFRSDFEHDFTVHTDATSPVLTSMMLLSIFASQAAASASSTVETDGEAELTTSEWLARSQEASCGITNDWIEGNCVTGNLGSFRLTEAQGATLSSAAAACLRACSLCERCRHISVSAKYKDCSWYYTCPRPAPFPTRGRVPHGHHRTQLHAALAHLRVRRHD